MLKYLILFIVIFNFIFNIVKFLKIVKLYYINDYFIYRNSTE